MSTISQFESFGLAKDRQAFINQLIPNSKDYYYFTLVNLLNQNKDGANDKEIEKILESCADPKTKSSLDQVITRFRLSGSAEAFYKWFNTEKSHFVPRFNHVADSSASQEAVATKQHPSTLDQSILEAWKTGDNNNQYTTAGLQWILENNRKSLDENQKK